MILYHMSDTLQLGDTLENDHKQQLALAQPFVQALARSEDCFFGMYLNGRYLRAVLGKFQLMDMWSDYVKWAAEGVFEYIRQREFPQAVSRMACNYYYDNLPDIIRLYEEDWGRADETERLAIRLYAIELPDDVPQRCDMCWFDRAYDALWDHDDLHTAIDSARRYYAGEATAHPVWEIMSAAPGKAVQELTQHIHP